MYGTDTGWGVPGRGTGGPAMHAVVTQVLPGSMTHLGMS